MALELQALDVRRLIFTLFQRPETRRNRIGTVVALTSPTPGEGVTHVSKLLARELAKDPSGRTLYCTTEELAKASLEIDVTQAELKGDGCWTLTPTDDSGVGEWEFNPSARCARLEMLRRKFDYVIVDCPAVGVSSEIARLGALADGVVVVVGAGRSNRQQIGFALSIVDQAGGTVNGFVLNRRTSPVPAGLYRLLKG